MIVKTWPLGTTSSPSADDDADFVDITNEMESLGTTDVVFVVMLNEYVICHMGGKVIGLMSTKSLFNSISPESNNLVWFPCLQ